MEILIVFAVIVVLVIVVSVVNSSNAKEDKMRYEAGKMSDEEKRVYENKLAQKEARRKAQTITKVQIIGNNSTSRKKAGSSIMRGAVGGALLGPVGLIGGAVSGKNKVTNTTTFLIQYEDGHKETRTVENNSFEFNTLIQYVDMEQ